VKILISGGAGFIGSSLARFATESGHTVVLFDNFTRPRSRHTARELHKDLNLIVHDIDLRNDKALRSFIFANPGIDSVWHLAGQVSYQASIADPINDFTTNAVGTQNILEACRLIGDLQSFIYSSTNKVYGDLKHLDHQVEDQRFCVSEFPHGFNEKLSIHPAGPYGVSKYAAELLCAEYAENYGIPATVFRQSSISGERQLATDDQGWVSYFTEKFVKNESYYFTGQGLQVRDILHVRDLYELFILASGNYAKFDTFNVGGGLENTISILELRALLKSNTGNDPSYKIEELRSKDQLVFISNNEKVKKRYAWEPKISKHEIIEGLVQWFQSGSDAS
jgi:CDP-paratose 2-epimerase